MLKQQGQLLAAEQIHMLKLVRVEKVLGPDHTPTLGTVNNFGVLYRDQDMLDEAEQMYQRALAGYEKTLGADHRYTTTVVTNLKTLGGSQQGSDRWIGKANHEVARAIDHEQ
jgi:hypothetical protein